MKDWQRAVIILAVCIPWVFGLSLGIAQGVKQSKEEKIQMMRVCDKNLYKYFKPIVKASYRFGVNPFLVASIICTETGFVEKSVSNKGARGIAQIMPSTGKAIARELNVKYKPSDTEQNILFCAYYLKGCLESWHWDREKGIASYNCGVVRAKRYKQIPETRTFVKRVLKCFKRYESLYGE